MYQEVPCQSQHIVGCFDTFLITTGHTAKTCLALYLQSHNVGVALLVKGTQGIKGVLPAVAAGHQNLGVFVGEPLQYLHNTHS